MILSLFSLKKTPAQVKFNNKPFTFAAAADAAVDEYGSNLWCDYRDVTLGFYEVRGNVFGKLHTKIPVDVD